MLRPGLPWRTCNDGEASGNLVKPLVRTSGAQHMKTEGPSPRRSWLICFRTVCSSHRAESSESRAQLCKFRAHPRPAFSQAPRPRSKRVKVVSMCFCMVTFIPETCLRDSKNKRRQINLFSCLDMVCVTNLTCKMQVYSTPNPYRKWNHSKQSLQHVLGPRRACSELGVTWR